MSTFAFLLFLVSHLSISLVDGMVSVCLSTCLPTHPHTYLSLSFTFRLLFICFLLSFFANVCSVWCEWVCVCVRACKVYLFWLFGCVAFDHSCCVRSSLPPHHLTTSLLHYLSHLSTHLHKPLAVVCAFPFSFPFPPLFPRLPALHSSHPNILNILNILNAIISVIIAMVHSKNFSSLPILLINDRCGSHAHPCNGQ